ncbi:MAG: site-2 protease family protein, partial [Eubacteriaceae bacterium]|nr:site-2 protease family protein [Eubacteriaceae bacterium]
MNTVLTITLSVLIFGFLILSHEFGHYLAARKCGVIVDEFSIGMGPLLAQKKKKGTFWSLRLLPLGGYCKMKGEDENDLSEGTFNAAKPIKRIIILLSGALMNLLTAVLLFFAIYAIQGTDATTTLAKVSEGSP